MDLSNLTIPELKRLRTKKEKKLNEFNLNKKERLNSKIENIKSWLSYKLKDYNITSK